MAVQKIILDIQAQTAKARKDINNLKTTTKGLNKEVNKTEQLMKKAATAMVAFASIGLLTRAIGNMVKLNIEFEKTLTNVLTLLDATSKAKFGDFLSAGALRTMSKFGLEIGDVNKALFDTISAGIKAGNSIKFLDEAAKLAIGGVTSLSIAVDGMTSIMNAYALSVEDANKVASAFFTAQVFGKTTVAELAQNVGMLAPTMKMAGVGFQEMLAGMALLTKQGISTDMATTALRATIIALTKTTPETEKVFEQLGIEYGITAIKTHGLGVTLTQIAEALEENEDLLTIIIPSVRALTAVAALGTEALVEYDELVAEITTDYGEGSKAAEAYALQMNTLRKRIDESKGAWEELMLTVSGEAEGKKRGAGLKELFAGLAIIFRAGTDLFTEITLTSTEDRVKIEEEKYNKSIKDKLKAEKEYLKERERIQKAFAARRLLAEQKEFNETIGILRALSAATEGFEKDDQEFHDKAFKAFTVEEDAKKAYSDKINDGILASLGASLDDQIKALKKKTKEDQTVADAELEIELMKQQNTISIVQGTAGLLRGLAGESFLIQQLVAIAESLVSTFLAGQLAYTSMVGIPVVGPALAQAAKTSAIIQGLANTAIIAGITIAGLEEGGFTGEGGNLRDSKGKKITGFVHANEYVLTAKETNVLRPMLDDIHYNRIDIHGLAALTRRGVMQTIPKLNADILEQQVEKIYRKMSESHPEKPVIIYRDNGYTKQIGNTTINVST